MRREDRRSDASAEEYAFLKTRGKIAMTAEEIPDWLVAKIAAAEMDERHAHLDARRETNSG